MIDGYHLAMETTEPAFFIVLADDHVERLGEKSYQFQRYDRPNAMRIAKGMAKKLGVKMHVMAVAASFEPNQENK